MTKKKQPRSKTMRRFTLPTRLQNPRVLTLSLFVVGFAAVGSYMLFRSFALGNSTVSGQVFNDTNRNGVLDAGETPFSGKNLEIYVTENAKITQWVAGAQSDANGGFSFTGLADGSYQVRIRSDSWSEMQNDWVPTTT